jgi:hypothetical protein
VERMQRAEMRGETNDRTEMRGARRVFFRRRRRVEYKKWWRVKRRERRRNEGAPGQHSYQHLHRLGGVIYTHQAGPRP